MEGKIVWKLSRFPNFAHLCPKWSFLYDLLRKISFKTSRKQYLITKPKNTIIHLNTWEKLSKYSENVTFKPKKPKFLYRIRIFLSNWKIKYQSRIIRKNKIPLKPIKKIKIFPFIHFKNPPKKICPSKTDFRSKFLRQNSFRIRHFYRNGRTQPRFIYPNGRFTLQRHRWKQWITFRRSLPIRL